MDKPRQPTEIEIEYIHYLNSLSPGAVADNMGLMFFHQDPLGFATGFANWQRLYKDKEEPVFTAIKEVKDDND